MANSKISALTSATTPVAGTEVLPIVQSSTTKQVSIANLTAGRAVSALSLTTTSDITLSGAATTNIYAYNPTAASGGGSQSSPRVSFYGSEWNSGTGPVTMSGYWQLQALSNNVASPTSKLSLYLAGNGGTPAEIGYFGSNSTLVLSIAGGASTTVQNSTAATSSVPQASGKYYLIGQSWNSAIGSTAQTSYIYAATDTNNANPTVEAIILAPSNGSGSQLEGFKFLGNGNANFTTGNLSFGTAAKGITTGGSFALGLGTNGSTSQASVDTSGNFFAASASGTTRNGNLTNGGQLGALATTGASRAWSSIYSYSASNNATVDAWYGRDAGGNVFGNNFLVGHFYVYVTGASTANSFSGVYSIVTTGNSTSQATLNTVSTVTRGTSPVTSVQIASDGVGGAIKLTITYINNSGVVTGGASTVTFVGQIS